MRVLQTEITAGLQKPFAVMRKKGRSFSAALHAHPELELVWIRRGRGQCIIGQRIGTFQENDLVLLGADLPHRWIYDKAASTAAQSTVLYFHPGLLAGLFYEMPSTEALRRLFQAAAATGLQIGGVAKERIIAKMEKMSRMSGLSVCLRILELLEYLSQHQADWQTPFGGNAGPVIRQQAIEDRLAPVYKYVAENFSKDISLAEVAALAHLSETAFCRLFKQRTQTHFVAYLNEVRVQHACERLMGSDDSISHISEECGFRSLSNFNKRFRAARGMSPMHYRLRLLGLKD